MLEFAKLVKLESTTKGSSARPLWRWRYDWPTLTSRPPSGDRLRQPKRREWQQRSASGNPLSCCYTWWRRLAAWATRRLLDWPSSRSSSSCGSGKRQASSPGQLRIMRYGFSTPRRGRRASKDPYGAHMRVVPVACAVHGGGGGGADLLGSSTQPPPPPCPSGPLSCQGSKATSHTCGGAEGARKIPFIPLAHFVHFAPQHYPGTQP